MTIFIAIVLIGLPVLVALSGIVSQAGRDGFRWDECDPDARRVAHDVDAIRTRFEEHPWWPSPGALGERR